MSMKNSDDTKGNRTCDLPSCSVVSQPTEELCTIVCSLNRYRLVCCNITVIWKIWVLSTFMWPSIVTNLFTIKPTRCTISQIYFGMKICIFWTLPLSIISSLFTVHSAMVYVIHVCTVDSFRAGSSKSLKSRIGVIWTRNQKLCFCRLSLARSLCSI